MPAPRDRLLGVLDVLAMTAPAREGYPDARYLGRWSYAVIEASDTTFSGRAISPRNPHPDLPGVLISPGIGGALVKPAIGSVVEVTFLDGDPAQPRVVGWDQHFAQHVALQSAASADTLTALTVDVSPAGVQVYDLANVPPAAFVAMASPVSSFATTTAAVLNLLAFATAAAGTAFTALSTSPAIVSDTATATACGVAGGALTAFAPTCAAAAVTISALIAPFPVGFTSTKLKTQ